MIYEFSINIGIEAESEEEAFSFADYYRGEAEHAIRKQHGVCKDHKKNHGKLSGDTIIEKA